MKHPLLKISDMKKIYTLFLTALMLITTTVHSQTSTENYIYTYDVLDSCKKTSLLTNSVPDELAIKTIQYFDGLGRPKQTIQKGFSSSNKDVVKPYEYNEFGVDTINYLPYVSSGSSGAINTTFKSDHAGFYNLNYSDAYGNAPVLLEKSPFQRVLKQGSAGAPWQIAKEGHPVSFEYLTNNTDAALKVRNWTITEEGICKYTGYYATGQLYVTKTTDEDLLVTYEFKDKQDRVVLKRSELSTTSFADTYYIYDDRGLLRFVISPEGSDKITGDITPSDPFVRQYVYCYHYDKRNRLIEKQIPGKEPEYFVYNKADQVVLYQDGNMRVCTSFPVRYRWLFTKYDGLGRVIITGITHQFTDQSRSEVQALVDRDANACFETLQYTSTYPLSTNNYYTNNAFPKIASNDRISTINYFDTYVISTSQGLKPIVYESNMAYNPADASFVLHEPELKHTTGYKTVTFTEFNYSLWPSVFYYDTRGRLIQERSLNHHKGIEINSMTYSGLTDKVVSSEHKHSTLINGINYAQTEKYTFSYDAEKRLTSRNYYLQNQLANRIVLTYNSMGDQVIKKEYFEGGTLRQTVDFQYNIKGWLTRINDPDNFTGSGDYFSMQLYYDKQVNSNINNLPRFNGNVSFIRWQGLPPIGSINGEIAGLKGYDFRYDELNRLKTADYFNVDQGRFTRTSKYTEMLTYDKNGNINTLKRLGYIAWKTMADPIDQLTYSYTGNQLLAVDDAVTYNNINDFFDNGHYYSITRTPEYLYDANGNLTQDLNKEIVNITYNELNLPKIIDFKNNNRIEYQYDALGTKKRQLVTQAGKLVKTTDFIGNFVYENNIPVFNSYDEGRIVYKTNRTYYAETYLKDHLGNIRVVFGNDGSGYGVMQTNTYYPFGMEILTLTENSTSPNNKNEYKYNGKMLQDELGLNWLDYGARFYDGVIGRWHSVDPLAEKHPNQSPYLFCNGNPIIFMDPDGRDGIITIKGGQINITSNIYLYGAGATKVIAAQYQSDINAKWGDTYSAKTSDEKQSFSVNVKVNVDLYEGKEKNDPFIIEESWNPYNRDNFIEVDPANKRSYVMGGDEGEWRSQGRSGLTLSQDDPAPHELGHLLGLDDRYTDQNGPNKGWEKNIMGDSQNGKVEQRNIDGILQDAMKAYEVWSKDKNNAGKVFKYEINTNNPNKENR